MASVKVLLIEDVYKLGHVGDVVNVKAGFARNYLLPQRLAVAPTKRALEDIEDKKVAAAAARAKRLEKKTGLADQINGLELSIEARANEGGRLFGSIGRRDILQAIAAKLGFAEVAQLDLPIDVVTIHSPIREPVEAMPIRLDIDEGIEAEVALTVVGVTDEEQDAREDAARRDAAKTEAGEQAEEAVEEDAAGDDAKADEPAVASE